MTRLNPGLSAVEDVFETCDELRDIAIAAEVCLLTGVNTEAVDSLADGLGSMVIAGKGALRKTYLSIGAIKGCPPEVEPLLGAAVALTMAAAAEKSSTELAGEVLDSSRTAAAVMLCDDVMTPGCEAVADAALDALVDQDLAKALAEIRNDPMCRSYLRDIPRDFFGSRLLGDSGPEGEPPDQ